MMQARDWMPRIDLARCAGCGACIVSCPTGALALAHGRAWLAHPEQCAYCALCETACPYHAIELPYLVVKQVERRASS